MTHQARTVPAPRRGIVPLARASALALLLAGCAGGPSGIDWSGSDGLLDMPRREARAGDYTLSETATPATALAVPGPEAGPVLEVVRGIGHGGVRQRVVLGGDAATVGENALDIRLSHEEPPAMTAATIRAEMRLALPGRELAMSDALDRNRYGPFGWAVTTRGAPRCAYAWQRVTGRAAGRLPGIGRRRTLDLRLRLCGGRATEAGIRAAMTGLHLTDDPERTLRADAAVWSTARPPQEPAIAASSPVKPVVAVPESPVRKAKPASAPRPAMSAAPAARRNAEPASGAFPMPPA